MHEADAEVLAIHCSDHRFQAGFYEFLNRKLKLDENYDLLVLPGGPQCLTLVEYLPKFSWAGWKWFRFLVDAHDLKRLILIQHQDCAGTRHCHFTCILPRSRASARKRTCGACGRRWPKSGLN